MSLFRKISGVVSDDADYTDRFEVARPGEDPVIVEFNGSWTVTELKPARGDEPPMLTYLFTMANDGLSFTVGTPTAERFRRCGSETASAALAAADRLLRPGFKPFS